MNIQEFTTKKQSREKIIWVTAYDFTQATLADKSEVDCVLVGDSVAMVAHGFSSTTFATMDMMVMHTQAVSRGIRQKVIVSDLPFLSYSGSIDAGLNHVKRLMDSGAQAVKLEGASPEHIMFIERLSMSGVPVVGHIGLQPQSVHALGGFKVQGRSDTDRKRLILEALALERAGCVAVVLECIPACLAKEITEQLAIATIGIGAGPDTDGQVLVWQDLFGMNLSFKPKFLKHFARLETQMVQTLNDYCLDVKDGTFPDKIKHSY